MSFKILTDNVLVNGYSNVSVYDFSSNTSTALISESGGNDYFAVPTVKDNVLYAYRIGSSDGSGATQGLKLIRSTDAGANWTVLAHAYNYRSPIGKGLLSVSKSNNQTYVFTGLDNFLFRISSDGGNTFPATWESLRTITGVVNDEAYGAVLTSRYVYILGLEHCVRHDLNMTNKTMVRIPTVISNRYPKSAFEYDGFKPQNMLQVIDGGGTDGKDLIAFIVGKYCNANEYGSGLPAGWYESLLISMDSGATFTEKKFPTSFFANSISGTYTNSSQSRQVSGFYLDENKVFVGGRGNWLFSVDLGNNWNLQSDGDSTCRIKCVGGKNLTYFIERHVTQSLGAGSNYSEIKKLIFNSAGTLQSSTTASQAVTGTYDSYGASSQVRSVQYMVTWQTNSSPTDISLSSASIAESAAANATVGTLSATDAEGGAMSWALVAGAGSTDNASFMIDGNALKLANGVSLDYETKSSYSIRVQATDAGGLTYAKAFTISVSNANEAPSSITLSANSIQEGNAVNAVIGTLSAIDPDTGDTSFTFSIVSGADKFNISGNSLRASVAFDYGVATSHTVRVRATDAGGAYAEQDFTINITDNTANNPVSLPATQVMIGGKLKANAAVDPRQAPVRKSDGSALPEGSVVKNTATNQKFIKKAGDELAYVAIEQTVPTSWKWSSEGQTFWAMLQDI